MMIFLFSERVVSDSEETIPLDPPPSPKRPLLPAHTQLRTKTTPGANQESPKRKETETVPSSSRLLSPVREGK